MQALKKEEKTHSNTHTHPCTQTGIINVLLLWSQTHILFVFVTNAVDILWLNIASQPAGLGLRLACKRERAIIDRIRENR